MIPIRNDPGRFRRPHANVLGRLVPDGLPTGSKAEMRRWIDLTNEAQHGGTCEVSLECAEEKNSVDCLDPVCSFHNNIYIIFLLFIFAQKRFTCIPHDT